MDCLKRVLSLCAVLLLLPVLACGEGENTQAEVAEILSRMTLREKICQMIIVSPEALSSSDRVVSFDAQAREEFELYPFGGMLIYGKNIENKEQLSAYTGALSSLSPAPFILAEEEGGEVSRVAWKLGLQGEDFPENIAAGNNPAMLYAAGKNIGGYLRETGFNMNLSPVADLTSVYEVDELLGRTSSSRPDSAAVIVQQYAAGMTEAGIIPVYKHFPGLGSENIDSHEVIPRIDKADDELYSEDILPFRAGIESGIPCIMMSNAIYTQLDRKEPACFSSHIIKDILRGELGFEGVIMTDAQDVPAIRDAYTEEDAIIKAISAGCDIILMPRDPQKAVYVIEKAVSSGIISEEQINESAGRIISLKLASGIWNEE